MNLDSEQDLPKYIREKKARAVMEIAAQIAGLAQSGNSSLSSLQSPVMQTVSSGRTRISSCLTRLVDNLLLADLC